MTYGLRHSVTITGRVLIWVSVPEVVVCSLDRSPRQGLVLRRREDIHAKVRKEDGGGILRSTIIIHLGHLHSRYAKRVQQTRLDGQVDQPRLPGRGGQQQR